MWNIMHIHVYGTKIKTVSFIILAKPQERSLQKQVMINAAMYFCLVVLMLCLI